MTDMAAASETRPVFRILSPRKTETGGPEALHQLCAALVAQGHPAVEEWLEDAADALGILAGQPTEIRVTALRKEETAAPVAAPAAADPAAKDGDAKKGEALSKPCAACHDFTKPGVSKVGPPLYGVVNRAKGHVAGFAYSDALKAKGGDWSFDELNKFIADPKKDIPGTKMAYAGEKDDSKRADIVAYLRSLADSPVALPK